MSHPDKDGGAEYVEDLDQALRFLASCSTTDSGRAAAIRFCQGHVRLHLAQDLLLSEAEWRRASGTGSAPRFGQVRLLPRNPLLAKIEDTPDASWKTASLKLLERMREALQKSWSEDLDDIHYDILTFLSEHGDNATFLGESIARMSGHPYNGTLRARIRELEDFGIVYHPGGKRGGYRLRRGMVRDAPKDLDL